MLNSSDLINLKSVKIADCSKDKMVDLQSVKINTKLPVKSKMNEYFKQIKNPYLFKVENTIIKVSFKGECSLNYALEKAISSVRNYHSDFSWLDQFGMV